MGKFLKVVVCGMKGVGKTAILEQVIYGNITEKSVSSYHTKVYLTTLNDKCFKGVTSNNRRYLCSKC